jgi:hypothetical protein
MSLGIGLSLSNSKAVLEAFLGKDTPFLRTPKHGVLRAGEAWKNKRYRGSKSLLPYLEIALGLYYSITVWLAIDARHWGALPFLVLFQLGFLYVGVMSLLQTFGAQPALADAPATDKALDNRRAA